MIMTDYILRLSAALIAGIILGLEREKRGRAAGLRTTVLVCLASCVAMMLSELLPAANSNPGVFGGDPARLAAGVLTGMGFLGAGVIIRQDTLIRGVTTAAVLWLACIIGLCCGSGHLVLGSTAVGLALFILLGLPLVERHMDNDGYVTIKIEFDQPGPEMAALGQLLRRHQLSILTTSVTRDGNAGTVSVHATAPQRDSLTLPDQVTRELQVLPGVRSATWSG
jgi:putative Mg2+ transporter-C (MgtC) family protein